MEAIRRSHRTTSVLYDSNGRDYLSAIMGWSCKELQEWLASAKVQAHLKNWYCLCIVNQRRFNDAIEWINTGENGYFYNPKDLEEDLLLACLGEGNLWDPKVKTSVYALPNIPTAEWSTQELWARTAWRIVQDNAGKNTRFRRMLEYHPTPVYMFVIDVLCIAFHSIAFRGEESIWAMIVKGNTSNSQVSSSIGTIVSGQFESEYWLDKPLTQQDDSQTGSVESDTEFNGSTSTDYTDTTSDEEFIDASESKTS